MKALLSKEAGGPGTLVLEDVAAPEAKPGQAVIAVKAAGVNFPDVLIIEDKYQFKPPRPFTPGGEIAGVVKDVGEGVTRVRPGDRVLGSLLWGGMAEEVAIDAAGLIEIPDSMPFDEAAAFIMTYGTSWHALKDRARLHPGETLLVLGAAGGVGLAAVELGKAMGARVIAAASSEAKVEFCKARGADVGVAYGRGPLDREAQRRLTEAFKQAAGPDGADVILDVVGGDYAEPALRSIAWEGRYLVVGFAGGAIPRIPLNLALLKGCDIRGVFWGAWLERNSHRNLQNAAELIALYQAGRIRPTISERFPLDRAAQAIERLASRAAMGKIVVTVGEDA